MSGHDFGAIVCGGGPAGLGPIVCAEVTGRLGRLLDDGVRVVERGPRLGPGSLERYRISGNSLSAAFLECVDEEGETGYLAGAGASAAAGELRRRRLEYPPLALVGRYLDEIGAATAGVLDAAPLCDVQTDTTVTAIRLLAEGGAEVATARERPGGAEIDRATGRRVVLAMGGRPPAGYAGAELAPGLALARWRDRLVHAADLIDRGRELPAHLDGALARRPLATIVGGSHSAWSAAWLLLNDRELADRLGARPAVRILHRHPVRLYYVDADTARADGYPFDPVADVCPLSGRVNRFAGLRSDAFELARRAHGFGADAGDAAEGEVECVALGSAEPAQLAAGLDASGLVVAAFGYDAVLPDMRDATGRPVELRRAGCGPVATDDAELLDVRGRAVPDVVAFGLGAGLKASPRVGGEPSYDGRLDGVWVYQHDIGQVALERMLAPAGLATGAGVER